MADGTKLEVAPGRVGSVAQDTPPPRSRKGHRKARSKGQINGALGMARMLRLGWWRAETW